MKSGDGEQRARSLTRYRMVHVHGEHGSTLFRLCVSLDAERDAGLFRELVEGRLHQVSPDGETLASSVLVQWPSVRECVLVVPSALAHRALLERARLLQELDEEAQVPDYVASFSTVIGVSGLRQYFEQGARSRSSSAPFRGQMGQTSQLEWPTEDAEAPLAVYTVIDGDAQPELLHRLLAGRLNLSASGAELPVPVLLHLPSKPLFLLYLPEALGHRSLAEQARVLRQLSQSEEVLPTYVVEFETVVGRDALVVLFDEPPAIAAVDAPVVAAREEAQSRMARFGWEPVLRMQSPSEEGRESRRALDLYSSLPQQFPGGAQQRSQAMFDISKRPFVAFRLQDVEPQLWLERSWRLLLQLHNLDLYPLLALVLVAVADDEGEREELVQVFDVASPLHRQLLLGLGERFSVTVGVYASTGALLDGARFRAPLERNVMAMLASAEERFGRDEGLDFLRAMERFGERSFPRIGAMSHPFSDEAFQWGQSPKDCILAVSILNYWMQPANYRYLVFNHSFSVELFEQLQSTLLTRAVDFGVRLPRVLRRVASKLFGLGQADLLRRQLANFAELHVALRNNDLDAFGAWENWRLLLEDAEEFSIPVEAAIAELAREALRLARLAHEHEDEPRVPVMRRSEPRLTSAEGPELDIEMG
ncbi:MAG: hypothetical protein RBU37_01135 [Myxococcota bacterium]|jgi:hypothetical protein|nr:hypothetical protein [Myxococcota bacterium]